jgi:hypothetical protein
MPRRGGFGPDGSRSWGSGERWRRPAAARGGIEAPPLSGWQGWSEQATRFFMTSEAGWGPIQVEAK